MPGVLSSEQIERFRALYEAKGMPSTCTISGRTVTANDSGGYSSSGSATASTPCRLRGSNLQPNERAVADKLGWSLAYAIDLPVSVEVDPTKTITLNGRTFEIGGVVDVEEWAMVKTAIVKERG